MSSETKYWCDRCGDELKKDGLTKVWAGLSVPNTSGYYAMSQKYNLDMCRPCLVLLGLRPSVKDDPPAPEPERTALDVITELVGILQDEEILPRAE